MQFHKEFYHKVPVLLTHIKSTSIIFDPNLNFDMLHCLCHKRFKVVLVIKFLGTFDRWLILMHQDYWNSFFPFSGYNKFDSNHQIFYRMSHYVLANHARKDLLQKFDNKVRYIPRLFLIISIRKRSVFYKLVFNFLLIQHQNFRFHNLVTFEQKVKW